MSMSGLLYVGQFGIECAVRCECKLTLHTAHSISSVQCAAVSSVQCAAVLVWCEWQLSPVPESQVAS